MSEVNWLGQLPVGSTVFISRSDRRMGHDYDAIIVKQGRDYVTLQRSHEGKPYGFEIRVKRKGGGEVLTTVANTGSGDSVYPNVAAAEQRAEKNAMIRKIHDLFRWGSQHRIEDLPIETIRQAAKLLGIETEK